MIQTSQANRIIAERLTKNTISEDNMKEQIRRCIDLSLKGNRGKGWTGKLGKVFKPEEKGDMMLHRVTVNFSKTMARTSLDGKWPAIVERFAKAGCAGSLRANPWVVVEPTGYRKIAAEALDEQEKLETRKQQQDEDKTLGEINLDPGNHYDRLYGRESQVRRCMDALHLAKITNLAKRRHTLLSGRPGGGKTECMLSTRAMLGKEGEAWRWYDAPNMTKAGVIEDLIKSPVVPPVLFIEEIEKVQEEALRWLLGVMDIRGEVRRTNYRVGNEARNVHMVVIASANNIKLLKTVMSGALYSRFQNKIWFPEPDRQLMARIITREVEEIEGDPEWVEPAMKFAFDRWGMTDPRAVTNIVQCGRDRLMNNSYQQDYEATMEPADKWSLIKAKRRRLSEIEKLAKKLDPEAV